MGKGSGLPETVIRTRLERGFPRLRVSDYRITSASTPSYNCIAWAAGDSLTWWWPSMTAHWPEGARLDCSLSAFVSAFAILGYARCDSPKLEPGYEKVALFSSAAGEPTHAARQLPNGRWSSKLGRDVDIEHSLSSLEGEQYGQVVCILRRPGTK